MRATYRACILPLAVGAVIVGLTPQPTAAQVGCAAYGSQAEAQAAYRGDPLALAALDREQDGLACESNRAPFDCEPVPAELRRGPIPEGVPTVPRACR